jgi:peptide/nickel transport system permease protein
MIRYLLRRLLQSIPTLFGITIISYGIMLAAPGGPAAALTFDPQARGAQNEARRQSLGLDDPVWLQYVRWLAGDDWHTYQITNEDGEVIEQNGTRKGILRGDFGRSFSHKRPVLELISDKIQATAELGILSLLISFGLGVPLGILAAVSAGGAFDGLTRLVAVFITSIPSFLLGVMLIIVFGTWLGWLPLGGRCPISISGQCSLMDRGEHLILPVFTLSIGGVAVLSRYIRSKTLDVLTKDYVRTAKAKGLPMRKVYFSHATRNALIPVATFLGPSIPGILGGSVIIEQVFSWQGLGRMGLEAALQQDYPVIMAFVLFGGVSTIFGYLLSDILYVIVDPRIRLD